MTRKQVTFLIVWLLTISVLLLGLVLTPRMHLFVFVAFAAIVSLFKSDLVPKKSVVQSPMEVLEQSRFWRAVAIAYSVIIVVTIVRHIFVKPMSVFENMPVILILLLMFGPAIGPIVVCQVRIFRQLANEPN